MLKVPGGYYEAFKDNVELALTDIAGISSTSALKYISGIRLNQIKINSYRTLWEYYNSNKISQRVLIIYFIKFMKNNEMFFTLCYNQIYQTLSDKFERMSYMQENIYNNNYFFVDE